MDIGIVDQLRFFFFFFFFFFFYNLVFLSSEFRRVLRLHELHVYKADSEDMRGRVKFYCRLEV